MTCFALQVYCVLFFRVNGFNGSPSLFRSLEGGDAEHGLSGESFKH